MSGTFPARPAPPPARQRVRLGMYAALAVIALAGLLEGRSALRLEQLRRDDAQLMEQAGQQRVSAQQIGRLAARLAAAEGPAQRATQGQSLEALLRGAAEQALAIESVLAAQHPAAGDEAVRAALERWQAARERLWYRGQVLLRHAEESEHAVLAAAEAAVQPEADLAQDAAQALSAALREAAEQRARGQAAELRWAMGALVALLVALAILVVEPSARAVRQDGLQLQRQADELQRLAWVAEHTSALVVLSDAEDRITWANAAFEQATGWPLAEALGRRPGELLAHPHADETVLTDVQEALRQRQGARHEWLHRTRDGADLWLDVDLRPLQGEGHGPAFVRVCSDVSVRVRQQAKLQALWSALPAGVVVQALDGSIVEANSAAEKLLGLTLAQLRGRDSADPRWRAVRSDGSDYPGAEHPAMRTLASGLALRNETMGVMTPEGQQRWLLVNTEPQRDAQGQLTGVVACFSDVSESRALQDRLADNARTDALTRLPNRAVVMERLERELAHAARAPGYGFALLYMDFDRFKQVNDTLGHAAGDELLRQIADRLARSLRPGDALARIDAHDAPDDGTEAGEPVAARLGGDEFVVVLDGVNELASAAAVADRLLAELAEPYHIEANPVQSTVSIGLVLCKGQADPAAAPTPDELLRNADTAMYEAKRAGRGRWVLFDDSMHERLVRAMEIEADLRRALKADELFVVYQPVLDLASRAMAGVEALVRWRHPQRGLVPPAQFIGVAEECGLIDEIGQQVLQMACRQFVAWQETLGPAAPRSLAVNLSRAQLGRAALVDDVRAVLEGTGMPPALLQLEVTESLAAQDERVQTTLRELKNLGVRLALDDFGTGYSSLACLHQMPVDTVKVDRSFVAHAESVEYHRVLIEATIRVARTLGMTTVAEGIETEGQADLMLALDCDRGQGFLFSRPQEAAQLEAWARRRFEHTADTV